MRARWVGLMLVLALLGAAGGYGLGTLDHDEPATIAQAEPVPAQSPSIPVDPPPTFAPDIDYPPLGTQLDYRPHRIGDPPYQWEYDAPQGWVMTTQDLDELRWRPAGEPVTGGFSLRVKLVSEHKTPQEMVDQKRTAVLAIYDDVEIIDQSEDELFFTYREPTAQTQRYDIFRWFTAPGGSEADFEMSVVGRAVDEPGLHDLLDHVAVSVRKLP